MSNYSNDHGLLLQFKILFFDINRFIIFLCNKPIPFIPMSNLVNNFKTGNSPTYESNLNEYQFVDHSRVSSPLHKQSNLPLSICLRF